MYTDRACDKGTIQNHKIARTGDARDVEIWTAAAAAAGIGIVAVLLNEKRKRTARKSAR